MPQTHHPPRHPAAPRRWSVRTALKRALLRPRREGQLQPLIPLPDSMKRQAEAAELMAQVRDALDRVEEQVVFGGAIFLNAARAAPLPSADEASVHSAPLPPMDFLRWPLSLLARLTSRAVRKFAAPLTRRQERFNFALLEAMRHLEARLEAQHLESQRLRQRLAELEGRRPE